MHELPRLSILQIGLIAGLALLTSHQAAAAQPEGNDSSGPTDLVGNLSADDPPTIRVLPLGVFHFNGAPDSSDPMAPTQQREIQAVIDSLLGFHPTKIAVEWPAEDSARLDSLYRAYQAGRHELRTNEIEQLGFRIAKRRGHPRVHAIDHKLAWPMDTVETWAQKHQPSFVRFRKQWLNRMSDLSDSLHRHGTIREILLHQNTKQYLSRIQEARMRTLEAGAGENYVGIEPPASLSRRNMRIFANLLSVVEAEDRVLIIYGSGHSYYFRRYVREHPEMKLIRSREHL